jgi:hypothetical protein
MQAGTAPADEAGEAVIKKDSMSKQCREYVMEHLPGTEVSEQMNPLGIVNCLVQIIKAQQRMVREAREKR